MERISHISESGQEKARSLGEERLAMLLEVVKKGVKRPFIEVAQLDQTVSNLQNKIATSFEQSRNESFDERKMRREKQTGWRKSFVGKSLLKSFDFVADMTNLGELYKSEQQVENEDRVARLKLDAIKAARLQELRERYFRGVRTRVGTDVASIEDRVLPAFSKQASPEVLTQIPSSSLGPTMKPNPQQESSLQEIISTQSTRETVPSESLQSVLQRQEAGQEAEVAEKATISASMEEPVSEKEYAAAMLEYMESVHEHRSGVTQELDTARAKKETARKRSDSLRTTKRGVQAVMGGDGLPQAA